MLGKKVEYRGVQIRQNSAQRQRDAGAIFEISFIVLCVLLAEWAILPFFGRNFRIGMIPVGAAFVFMFCSHLIRGETVRDLGWRADNFLHAMSLLLPSMLLGSILLVIVGWCIGGSGFSIARVRFGWPVLWMFMSLYLWGLLQQYALQAFINRRAQLIWGRGMRSVLAVALIFGLLHLPNLWLTGATFIAGLLWAAVYQRTPNLFALGLAHSAMTIVLIATVPTSALHGMRVGYNYY